MDHDRYMNDLKNSRDIKTQIQAVNRLADRLGDAQVLHEVCRVACETRSHQVRGTILAAMTSHMDAASRIFIELAEYSPREDIRTGALMNLSLAGWRNARAVVMKGLLDPSPAVRLAAFLHIGLYLDADALEAFKRFAECHRSVMPSPHLKQRIVQSWHWTKRICLQAAKNHNRMDLHKPPKLQVVAPPMPRWSGAVLETD